MKRIVALIGALTLSAGALALGACVTPVERTPDISAAGASRSLIIYHSGQSGPIKAAAQARGARVFYDLTNMNVVALRVKDGDDVDREIAFYQTLPGVNSVTRDGVSTTQAGSTIQGC